MKSKILLVDDEVDILLLLRDRLEGAGYQVEVALDAEETKEVLKSYHPDLIVLDIMLPQIDGYELCKRLKTDPKTTNIPVIMLTVRAAGVDRKRGLAAGAVEYLTKPFEGDHLLTVVAKQLKK